MLARRLSVVFSLLALVFLTLACTLGYKQGPADKAPQAVQAAVGVGPVVQPSAGPALHQLDEQLETCAEALIRPHAQTAAGPYPASLRRLVAIKKRDALQSRMTRALGAGPAADSDDVRHCLSLDSCDGFARCVTELLDE